MVKVPEGLVLAADSATTVQAGLVPPGHDGGTSGILKVFLNATKVFQIRDLPVGVLTWGAGAFQARTIASLVEEFENSETIRETSRQSLSIRDVADTFWDFMRSKSDEFFAEIPIDSRPRSGFVICGYSKSEFFPEEYAVVVPTNVPQRVREPIENQPNFGANWYGSTDAIVRLHHGRDDRIFNLLRRFGMEEEQLSSLREKISQEIQYTILFHAMPLGDAIDYAEFIVQTTISRFRFVVGAEVCGGPVDIATITRKEGFRWVVRKGEVRNDGGDKASQR